MPSALSGGERQRVAIGRALARRPQVILLDEPFSNLDLPLRASLREQVIELQRRSGTTLVHVTHDQGEAMLMGHRLVILHEGRALQVDTPRTIYESPAHRFVASFVGNPPINFLPCIIEAEGASIRVQPVAADRALGWNTSALYLPAAWDGRSSQLELAVRPEALALFDSASRALPQPACAILSACVSRLEYTGPDLLAALCVGPHRLVARASASRQIYVRDQVKITLDMRRVSWFDRATGAALPARYQQAGSAHPQGNSPQDQT
jgi:ABC-type sugar transport system ATPase subunit